MEIFIDNLNDEMSYQLKLQCLPSFQKLIDNDIQIEEALIKKGTLKFSKEGYSSSNKNYNNNYYNNNSDKSKFWTRIKNVINDGVVDANHVKSKQPVLNLLGTTPTNNYQGNTHQGTNNQENNYQRNNSNTKLAPY